MTGNVARLATVTAVGAATTGGVFFAFSTFVMRALRNLEPRQGLTAMQSINRAAPNPLFMTLLLGTAVLSGGVAVVGLRKLDDPGAPALVAGGVLYLVAVGITAGYHVPRNDALALLDPGAPGAARAWIDYASAWTTWNHVRTVTSIAAAGALVWAVRVG